MKLYGYWRSTSTWRVRIGLALKGIDHIYEPVNLMREGGEQQKEPYGKVNPLGQVPTLEWEQAGKTYRLSQSMAILLYLEDRFQSTPLLSTDAFLRARAIELAEIVNSGIQPLQNLAVLRKIKHELAADEQAWAREFIERGLHALEERAQHTAGQYLIGDEVGLADVYLVPQLYAARRFSVDLSPFESLLRIEKACEALEGFQKAHADRQPDAPAQSRSS